MDEKSLEILRHSTSHVMAHAVKSMFPSVKLAIGPSIENGFYYDFDFEAPITENDIPKIEEKMREIIKSGIKFVKEEIKMEDALEFFENRKENYKVELIKDIKEDTVTIYKNDDFVDLCRGPHLESTADVKVFKLLNIAGAYWRGNEKNKMLTRIYGTAFFKKENLDEFLRKIEEAKQRDHRKIGKELDLFSIQEDAGPGLIFWHPKGSIIRKLIEDFWKESHLNNGYELINIPHISKINLWQISGHMEFYKDYIYSPMEIDTQKYIVKPMNCPGHILIYKTKNRSYKDLPIRWAELGTVYRYEKTGVLHGLMRVRGFTQDDAHIFCTEDQIEAEIISAIEFTRFILKTFGFEDYDVYLSTRPEKYVGSLDNWEKATSSLKKALEKAGFKYEIDPGEGVFYGPKIDIKIKDAIGRSWQCTTIQVDFNLPERFDVNYTGGDGKEHRVIMIHRALMGSLERFFGILIEHYKGAFPFWLAPVQVRVMAITDKEADYAVDIKKKIEEDYKAFGKGNIRVDLDTRQEKINYKIREAESQKIPFMVIVGKKEAENGKISVRERGRKDHGVMDPDTFLNMIKN